MKLVNIDSEEVAQLQLTDKELSNVIKEIKEGTTNEAEPEFAEAIPNITIPVGRDIQLPCVVENLGSYRAAWIKVETKAILTIHHHIITRNYRISLSHSDNRNFVLHIRNVQKSDRGGYMCQINTVPMKSQIGFVDVLGKLASIFGKIRGLAFILKGHLLSYRLYALFFC
ncbi:uncharacterized protein LOC118195889 [Stegodyphus dumicola]|uniref:uncharacterized protein LOC118195889 n=1 Tax=Stegodyphus dumicola TaxID=202533 RepID=UPI0015AE95C4|nr:uncharacterized protein LOC118195889 [Stegodyphus dumicola]